MNIVETILNVKPDVSLERAIAGDVGSMDTNDLTESFLNQMSVDYPHHKGPRKLVVEDPSNEGADFIADDTEKNKKIPSNG